MLSRLFSGSSITANSLNLPTYNVHTQLYAWTRLGYVSKEQADIPLPSKKMYPSQNSRGILFVHWRQVDFHVDGIPR